MMWKTVALAALCGLAQIGRAEVQAFANVSAGDTSPGVATIMAEVTGTGDVFAEYAYDRANHFRSAKDCYVTNGLIAMWDGIDNMGRGSHVTGATTWRDLVGGHLDMTFTAPPTVGANYYQLTRGGCGTPAADIAAALNDGQTTVEIVCSVDSITDDATIFACVDGTDQETGGAGNRLAWVRHRDKWIIGALEYKATGWASGTLSIDETLGAVRQYAFLFNHPDAPGNVVIATNGAFAVTARGTTAKGIAANAWFSLGQRVCKAGTSATISDMRVHCVRVYNRILTDAERRANVAADRMRFEQPPAVDLDNPGTAVVERTFAGTAQPAFVGAKDYYEQNGLIAMWDGEDNQGTGTHDAEATTWKDLVGNHADMTFTASPTVGANYYDLSQGGGGVAASDIGAALNAGAATVEIVCDVRELVNDGTLFACVDGTESAAGNRIAWVRSGTPSSSAPGVVGAMEYKATASYMPYPKFDMTTNAVRSYTFKFGTNARVYKNGSSTVGTSVESKGVLGTAANAWFSLGQRVSKGGTSATIFKVRVYCVRVYNRELTVEEVAANHTADVKRFFGTANEWPFGSRRVRNADGTDTVCRDGRAAFKLTGLRPDLSFYTVRLTTTNEPLSATSAPVVVETAAERPAATWYEFLDTRNNQTYGGNPGEEGAIIQLNFTPNGRVPVVETRFQMLEHAPAGSGQGHWLFGTGGNNITVTSLGMRTMDDGIKLRYMMGDVMQNAQAPAGFADLTAEEIDGMNDLVFNGPDGLVLNGQVRDADFSGIADYGTTPWVLFGRYIKDNEGHNYWEYSRVRIWSFKLGVDGEPFCDLVPACSVDGTPCMFDRVSMKFLPNVGKPVGKYQFAHGGELPGLVLGSVSRTTRRVQATVTRVGTAASDLYVAYGEKHGGADLSAWEHVEQLPEGFAADGTSVEVNVDADATTCRYVRFFSLADGWSDSVYLPDAKVVKGLAIIIR